MISSSALLKNGGLGVSPILAKLGIAIALSGIGCIPFGGVLPPLLNPGGNPGNDPSPTDPDGCFDGAMALQVDPNGGETIEDVVGISSEVDLYDLGSLAAGDRVTVHVTRTGGDLDPQIALFDSQCRIYVENDDIVLGIDLDSRIDEVLRRSSDRFYLAIGSSTFGVTTGSYRATVQIARGGSPPKPVGQTILLNFAGGSVQITDFGTERFGPFDAANIDDLYDESTSVVADAIEAAVRENFAPFNVAVLRRDPGDPEPDGRISVVHLGEFSSGLFGIADDVDVFNAIPTDDAVVFTEQFTPDLFSETPSAAELGLAIGNIAAHEAGHLLGLNHVIDANALMDNGHPADSFLLDQDFKDAPLDSEVFRIGTQDAVLLLAETVGPAAGSSRTTKPAAPTMDPADNALFLASDRTKRDWTYCFCRKCCGHRLKAALTRAFRP